MSLSEREWEILAAIERNMSRESPALVSALRAFRIGRGNRHASPARGIMARGAPGSAAPASAARWTGWRVAGVVLASVCLAVGFTLLPLGGTLHDPVLLAVGLLGLAVVPALLGAALAGRPWRAGRVPTG
jgi:hypothetical protein